MSKTVLIGMPNQSGSVPIEMVQSLLQLRKPYPCAFMPVIRQRVEKARNAIAMQALANKMDYLFFVDDDNPIPADALELMIKDNKDIVIAPILARSLDKNEKYPLCAFYVEDRKIKKKKLRYYNNITEFKDKGPLHRIDAGGTGCMLIKRKVLVAMQKKWKNYMFEFGDITVEGQRRTMSEDAEFCERAGDLGFEIWLDDRIKPLHITGFNYNQYGKL